ncbi:hypothetical protein IL306_003618 [Fusarium sp. DS 682]|nr:hypothetical protein IL306_003618 [Fusarium sp. DS 682]
MPMNIPIPKKDYLDLKEDLQAKKDPNVKKDPRPWLDETHDLRRPDRDPLKEWREAEMGIIKGNKGTKVWKDPTVGRRPNLKTFDLGPWRTGLWTPMSWMDSHPIWSTSIEDDRPIERRDPVIPADLKPSRLPASTKTPYRKPDYESNKVGETERPEPKGENRLKPARKFFRGPTERFATFPGSARPTPAPFSLTGRPLRPLQTSTRNGITSPDSETVPDEITVWALVSVVITVGVMTILFVALLSLMGSLAKAIGRKMDWKWVKRSDNAKLAMLLDHYEGKPDSIEPRNLDLIRMIMARKEGPSYYSKDIDAASMYSTDYAPLTGPPAAHLAPSRTSTYVCPPADDKKCIEKDHHC